MQGVCEEHKKEKELEEKNNCLLKYFAVKGSTLEACRRTATMQIQLIFSTTILYTIKVIY